MASIPNRPLGSGAFVLQWVASAAARIIAWNDARVTRAALARLSDHELDDLGLSRGDIDAMAQGGNRLR